MCKVFRKLNEQNKLPKTLSGFKKSRLSGGEKIKNPIPKGGHRYWEDSWVRLGGAVAETRSGSLVKKRDALT